MDSNKTFPLKGISIPWTSLRIEDLPDDNIRIIRKPPDSASNELTRTFFEAIFHRRIEKHEIYLKICWMYAWR